LGAKKATVDARVLELVELEDRQQLDAVDAELFQIRDLLAHAGEGAGVLHARGLALREAAHVHLVDHQLLARQLERPVVLPVEVLRDEPGPVAVPIAGVGREAPDLSAAHRARHRVEQHLGLVEALPLLRVRRPIHPIAVLDVLEVEIHHRHGEHVADPELLRERDLGERLARVGLEQHQRARGRVTRIDGEVEPARHRRRAERNREAAPQREALVPVGRMSVDARHWRGRRHRRGRLDGRLAEQARESRRLDQVLQVRGHSRAADGAADRAHRPPQEQEHPQSLARHLGHPGQVDGQVAARLDERDHLAARLARERAVELAAQLDHRLRTFDPRADLEGRLDRLRFASDNRLGFHLASEGRGGRRGFAGRSRRLGPRLRLWH
jgi:hypothetical protein